MSDIKKLTRAIVDFRDARDWKQFHNPKDEAIALLLETTELLEHFQWRNTKETAERVKSHRKHISDELADVLYWVLLMCHDLKIDIEKESYRKLNHNKRKYPIRKAKGKHSKYTELQ